jgi:hypothetical protein
VLLRVTVGTTVVGAGPAIATAVGRPVGARVAGTAVTGTAVRATVAEAAAAVCRAAVTRATIGTAVPGAGTAVTAAIGSTVGAAIVSPGARARVVVLEAHQHPLLDR